jgi:plastocyanin
MGRSMFMAIGLIVIIACGGGDNGTNPCADCGGGGTLAHASRVTATAAPLAFDPAAVSIPAGDTIYFTFQTVLHNVTFDTKGIQGYVQNSKSSSVKR